jgi:hypothetical protein
MARTVLLRAFASAGSVIALAAVVGAGTKWW